MQEDGWEVAAEVTVETDPVPGPEPVMRGERPSSSAGHPFQLAVHNLEPVAAILQRDPGMAAIMNSLAAQPKAKSTVSNYAVEVRRYQQFCAKHGYLPEQSTEQGLLHYVGDLVRQKVTLSVLLQVKPALDMYLQLQGQQGQITDRVVLFLEAAQRQAAQHRQPAVKAPEIQLQLLRDMVDRFAAPAWGGTPAACPMLLRTVARVTVIYFTLCRGADYLTLQARHVEEHGEDLILTFPKTKTDQLHNGSIRVLRRREGNLCAVKVLKAYMRMAGMKWGKEHQDRRHLHSRIRKTDQGWKADKEAASMSTAREELQKILVMMGLDKKAATDKSFKMLGVTSMLNAGISAEEVALHGGWAKPDIVQRYRHNSVDYKQRTADRIPV